MRKVQITLELPDTFSSINQLEAIIDAKGQRIKQQLFETELAHLIDQEQQNSDSAACPSCKKKVSFQKATNRDN